MAKNGDHEAATRSLREITHIHDGVVVKALKGLLERQTRIFARLEAVEDELAAVRKGLQAIGRS